MSKKILFLSINNIWTPHFETELELMSNHLDKGDDVYVLTCNKKLTTCSSIPEIDYQKRRFECLRCRARFWNGLKKISLSSKKVKFFNRKVSRTTTRLLPGKFSNLDDLKKFKLFDVDFGTAVSSSLISELRDHNFDTVLHKQKVFANLYSSVLVYESVYKILKKIEPNVFYIFNGRFMDSRPALRAAQQLGIPFYLHERAGGFGKYIIRKNCFIHDLNAIKKDVELVWNSRLFCNEKKETIASNWFLDRRRGVDQGWASFTKKQKQGLLPLSFDSSKKNIVIFNSSSDEFETFPSWKMGIYKSECNAYEKIFDEFKNREDIKFYIRVHPGLKKSNNSQIKSLKKFELLGYKNVEIIWPEEKVDTYKLIEISGKVIVFYSTVGVETCFWGKPSILLGRAVYEDLDCCYIPKDHEEVINMIVADLPSKNKKNTLKYAYWEAMKGISFKKFKQSGIFSGSFFGEEISAEFGWREIISLAFFDRKKAYFKFKKKVINSK